MYKSKISHSRTPPDKRLVLLGALLIVLASTFWLSSRYPALNTKAMMNGSIVLEDGLSFEALLDAPTQTGELKAAGVTFINWLDTNKKGMAFGLSFAVVLLAMLPLIKPLLRNGMTGVRASLAGTILGAPLGVCVNCAAPIAYGLYRGGARAETVLATMISSPTLNVVILSMTLTLFPMHMALIKIGMTLALLFVMIPWLVRLFPQEATQLAIRDDTVSEPTIDFAPSSWLAAAKFVGTSLVGAAREIIVGTVPLMIVAGLFGAIVITFVPWEILTEILPKSDNKKVLIAMMGLALFGLFLPVPIAFDIIVVAMLLAAGMDVKYAAVLLFVLGSFSIYSWLILWRAGAVKLASALAISIAVLGVSAGVASHYSERFYQSHVVNRMYARLLEDEVIRETVEAPKVPSEPLDLPQPLKWTAHPDHPAVLLAELAQVAVIPGAGWRMEKNSVGFVDHRPPMREFMHLTKTYANTLAVADVNTDGYMDVLVSNLTGVQLYMNKGGNFTLAAFDPKVLPKGTKASSIAFADLDANGTPDLVYAVADDAVYYSFNQGGQFGQRSKLTDINAKYILAIAFGDVNVDGDLDILLGHHDIRMFALKSSENSQDFLFLQDNKTFKQATLPDTPAETLSVLISDLNHDGRPDRMHASEFENPDNLFWGARSLGWKEMSTDHFSVSTATTMSIDSADINNDLLLDVYQAQISANPPSPPALIYQESLRQRANLECLGDDEFSCRSILFRRSTRANGLSLCNDMGEEWQADCIAYALFSKVAVRRELRPEDHFLAKHYPEMYAFRARYTEGPWREVLAPDSDNLTHLPSQSLNGNFLHVQGPDGRFEERGKDMGVSVAGWTWNSQFADLDGDGYQDLFTANGWYGEPFDTENVWFRNIKGTHFVNATEDSGLRDLQVTMSAVQFDADNDGDLDLLTQSPSGKLNFYNNKNNQNQFLQVELTGASTMIGSHVIVQGQDGSKQLREVKKSGGFQSYGPALTQFGLGQQTFATSIEIKLLNGGSYLFEGDFPSGNRYRINIGDKNE